jgi:hypothetical protein
MGGAQIPTRHSLDENTLRRDSQRELQMGEIGSQPADNDPEHGRPSVDDLDGYLAVARPENAVMIKFGPQIVESLQCDKRLIRMEDELGWAKWVRKDSFLRGIRLASNRPISIRRFRETYGEEAFEAVNGDVHGFYVDLDSDTIHVIPIDLLSDVKDIVIDHYRFESEAGYNYELEPVEWMRRRREKGVHVRLLVDDRFAGRFIGRDGGRIKSLSKRILSETGVNATVVILKSVERRDRRKVCAEAQSQTEYG